MSHSTFNDVLVAYAPTATILAGALKIAVSGYFSKKK